MYSFAICSSLVKIPSGQSPHHLQCIQSKLYTKSSLLDGPNAGLFTDVGRVASPYICTRLCCEDPSCDLAYMFSRTCFLVRCNSERSCRTIPDEDAIRTNSTFGRSIQYIVRRQFGVRLRDGKAINSLEGNMSQRFCSFFYQKCDKVITDYPFSRTKCSYRTKRNTSSELSERKP